jgi:hypothetical protein
VNEIVDRRVVDDDRRQPDVGGIDVDVGVAGGGAGLGGGVDPQPRVVRPGL